MILSCLTLEVDLICDLINIQLQTILRIFLKEAGLVKIGGNVEKALMQNILIHMNFFSFPFHRYFAVITDRGKLCSYRA